MIENTDMILCFVMISFLFMMAKDNIFGTIVLHWYMHVTSVIYVEYPIEL